MTGPLLPDLDDPVTAPHWEGARDGRLLAPRCTDCGLVRWPPAELCPRCLSAGTDWIELTGTGTVWSFAVYHRAMHPAFAEQVPYTVAAVDLDEGVRMVGIAATSTGDADADGELAIGARVAADFDPVTDEVTLVRWRPLGPPPPHPVTQEDPT